MLSLKGEKLVEELSTYLKVSNPRLIYYKTRRGEITKIRHIVIHFLVKEEGFTLKKAAKTFNSKNHDTAINAIKRAEEYFLNDTNLLHIYHRCQVVFKPLLLLNKQKSTYKLIQLSEKGAEIKRWKNNKLAADFFKVTPAAIFHAYKTGGLCCGYKWKRIP